MSQFAVLRVMKYNPKFQTKDNGLSSLGAHIDRHHIAENVDQRRSSLNETVEVAKVNLDQHNILDLLGHDIDKSRTYLNRQENAKRSRNLEEDIERRIKEGHTARNKKGDVERIKQNSVRALFFILTGSHERMHEIYNDKKLWQEWKRVNENFLVHIFGRENIVRFEAHLDEKTPHIHGVVVPINKDGRLSAKSFIDGPGDLKKMQDLYAKDMKPFGLERGIEQDISHRSQRPGEKYNPKVREIVNEAIEYTKEINAGNALVRGRLEEVRREMIDRITQLKTRLETAERSSHYQAVSNRNLIDKRRGMAFEQSLKEAVNKDLETIKKNVEIAPFLKARGWELIQEQSTRKEEVLVNKKNGTKIIVPASPDASGDRIFFYEKGGKGTLIDLLVKAKWDQERIHSLAHGAVLTSKKSSRSRRPGLPVGEFSALEARKKVEDYLSEIQKARGKDFLQDMGIEKRTHTSFHGLKISQEAAAFPMYRNFTKKGEAELVNALTYQKDEHGNQEERFKWDKRPGISMLLDLNYKLSEVKRIIVTQDPMDGLRYRQLQNEGKTHHDKREAITSSAFLGICGSLTEGKERDMRIVFEMARDNDQTVVLALDNDLKGRKMRETLLHIAEESGCNYEIEAPMIGKSWNEELLKKEKENIYQSISERRWKMFEEVTYEVSILPKIAIEKETLEAFKNTLKIGDKDMLIAFREIGKEEISSTWHLEMLSSGKAKVIMDEVPEVSILKGNPQGSSELVLVTSPLDALVHYQSLEAKGDICYAMVNAKELEKSLLELVEQDNWKHIVVARGEKNIGAKTIHDFLREEKVEVTEVRLDVEDLQRDAPENLGISKETIEAFKEKVKVELEQEGNKLSEGGEQVVVLEEKKKLEERKSNFSVIYGDMKEAEKIVLVVSKNDAMLHYERERATGNESFKTCYVLGEVGGKELLKEGAKTLQEYAQKRGIELSIASSKENMPGARSLRYAFKEESMRLYTERLKKEISLADFLEQELDWKRLESRSGRENDVLTHPKSGENIVIPRLPQENGHRVFSYEKGGGGGTIIDLLVEEKWDWKQIAKLAEKKFLPKIEEVENPRMSQILATSRQEEANIRMSPISNAPSRNAGNPLEANVPSIALGALSLLSSFMKASYAANQGDGEDDEQKDKDRKEEQEKGRRFGR